MCSLGDQSFLQNRQTVDFGENFAPTSKNRIARNHAYFVSAVRGAHLTIFRWAGYQEFNRVNSQNPSHAYENSGKEGAHLTLRASPAFLSSVVIHLNFKLRFSVVIHLTLYLTHISWFRKRVVETRKHFQYTPRLGAQNERRHWPSWKICLIKQHTIRGEERKISAEKIENGKISERENVPHQVWRGRSTERSRKIREAS